MTFPAPIPSTRHVVHHTPPRLVATGRIDAGQLTIDFADEDFEVEASDPDLWRKQQIEDDL